MTLLPFAIIAVLVMAAIYFFVIRGGLALVSKRLDEDPELAESIPDDDSDGLPTDVTY